MWEDCANRIIRTSTIEKAILLVTDPDKMTQEELARQVARPAALHGCMPLARPCVRSVHGTSALYMARTASQLLWRGSHCRQSLGPSWSHCSVPLAACKRLHSAGCNLQGTSCLPLVQCIFMHRASTAAQRPPAPLHLTTPQHLKPVLTTLSRLQLAAQHAM